MRTALAFKSVRTLAVALTAALAASAAAASAATVSTVATFNRTNGAYPYAGLIIDSSGNLYGTTGQGGTSNNGTVFKIAAGTNALTTLATFNYSNGRQPSGELIADAAGNLYGTTARGASLDAGTVFKVAAGTNTLTTLATFSLTNGEYPHGSLLADASGNLYGTTALGGPNDAGTVFKVAAGTNALTTVATFNKTTVGDEPCGLIADASGNLYGTTQYGGSSDLGTVFKVAAGSNTVTTLATFNNTNGANPWAGVIADGAGNLIGTTNFGGSSGGGTVFKVDGGTNVLTTLATFNNTNGENPWAGVIADAAGNLYGTTEWGGPGNYGTVFKVAAGTNTLTTLATFNYDDGAYPEARLIADGSGNLYGTTQGGANYGTVFKLTNTGFVVPEPASLSVLALSGISLLRYRAKRTVTSGHV